MRSQPEIRVLIWRNTWWSGLVRAYLAIPKQKEALCAAREAMRAMPHSAKALTLVGDVYAHNPDGREKVISSAMDGHCFWILLNVWMPKICNCCCNEITPQWDLFPQIQAQKFYESALRSEPGFLGAVLALADLHGREGRNDEATVLLQQYLKNWADDSLHTKLAQILAATEKLGESLSHYQTALRYELSNKHRNRGLLLYVQIYSFGWYSLRI